MTSEGLLRRYYAIRSTEDRRKLDALVEEAAAALLELQKRCKLSGCPPHHIVDGKCVNCDEVP